MKLSENFYLDEFTKSETGSRLKFDNTPNSEVVKNLSLLCERVLQPIRDHFKLPVVVTSGYRSKAINRAIGSKDTSQHILGQAADFTIPSIDNYTLATWIEKNLNYDQLILEFYFGGNTGWIHVGYTERHKNQELTINKYGVFNGLKKY